MKNEPQLKFIYCFAPFNLECPSTRYRGYYPLKYLEEHYKIKYRFIYPSYSLKGILNFMSCIFQILFFRKKNSLIFIQKVYTNRYYANVLKLLILFRPAQSCYDIDDAEQYRQKSMKTVHFFLSRVSFVTVGSQALKTYCEQFNSKVFIQTSPVSEHQQRKQKRNDLFTIGWVGDFGNGNVYSKNFSHKTSLYKLLFPHLKELKFPLKLLLIGIKKPEDIPEIENYFVDAPHIELEIPKNLNWKEDDWVYEKITNFDLGLSPMLDHPFNQAKSAFKAKQYLSAGLPVLASDVGENANFVHPSENGALFNTANELLEKIQFFAELSKEDYLEYMNNAWNSRPNFSMKLYAEGLIGIYEKELS